MKKMYFGASFFYAIIFDISYLLLLIFRRSRCCSCRCSSRGSMITAVDVLFLWFSMTGYFIVTKFVF